VTAHQAVHQVATMCRVLGVSPSGYYAWRKRPLSTRARTDVELTAHIEAIHRMSRGTYGALRIHSELAARGLRPQARRPADEHSPASETSSPTPTSRGWQIQKLVFCGIYEQHVKFDTPQLHQDLAGLREQSVAPFVL